MIKDTLVSQNSNSINTDKFYYPKIKKRNTKKWPLTKYYIVTMSPEQYNPEEAILKTFDEQSYEEALLFYNMIFLKHNKDRYITLIETFRENGLCKHDLDNIIKIHRPEHIKARNIRE